MENRKYVALSVVDGVIEQIGKPIDESELKDESKEMLIECNKDIVNSIFSASDEGKKPDYIGIYGQIYYYFDSRVAKDFLSKQRELIKKIKDARERLIFISNAKYVNVEAKENALNRENKHVQLVNEEYYNLIESSFGNSFSGYARIVMSEIVPYKGSMYFETDIDEDIFDVDISYIDKEATVKVEEFQKRMSQLGYVEGVTPCSTQTIESPSKFFLYSIRNLVGNDYFGYNVPLTAKSKKDKKLGMKMSRK